MNTLLIFPNSPRNLNIGNNDKSVRIASKKAYSPPLGLLTVASLLPLDWELRLIDLSFQSIAEQDWNSAELVLLTGTILQLPEIYDLVKIAKTRDKIVAVGGAGVFHYPERTLNSGADFVIKGEGENTVPIMLEYLSQGISNKIIQSPTPVDLALSPVPRFDLLDMNAYVDMALQISRGCPFQCEFCDATQIFGRKVRLKAPDQVINELQALYDAGWRRQIYVVDDNLIGNQKRIKPILEAMISWMQSHENPFEFFTHASVNLAENQDLLDLVVKAGFSTVYLGIETTDPETLRTARKTQNTGLDLYDACRTINEAGLEIMAGTIIGFDGEKPGRDKSLVEFVQRTNIPLIEVSLLHAYPGTALWDRLRLEGRLLDENEIFIGDCHYLRTNYVPTRPMDEILSEFVSTMKQVYDPAGFLERSYNHFACMKPLPMKVPAKPLTLSELHVLGSTLVKWGVIRSTRYVFWKYLWKAFTEFHLRRVYLFIRSCVTLERYHQLSVDLSAKLDAMKPGFISVTAARSSNEVNS